MSTRSIQQRGFTLAEMVIVIVITGIIAGMVAVFIRSPVQGYFDLERRVELTDTADTALRRIGRDIRLALPNSIRVSGSVAADNIAISFLQTRTGGRYRATPPGHVLDTTDNPAPDPSSSTVNIKAFDVLGPMNPAPAAGDQVVVYNLGIEDADAYAGNNRATVKSYDSVNNRIELGTPMRFPFESPSRRFQIVDTPVTYRCNGGRLTRWWGYAINSAPADPPGGQSAIIAQNVAGCVFAYEPLVNDRNGLVSLQITLRSNNEIVTLYHEVHVSNVP